MKKLTNVLLAVWVFNMSLWFMYNFNRPAYEQMVANGAQWFNCVDWTPEGQAFQSDGCR